MKTEKKKIQINKYIKKKDVSVCAIYSDFQ